MSDPPTDIGTRIFAWLARALGGPKAVARHCAVATLSVAEICLDLISDGVAVDISRIKEALLRKTEAEADAKVAEAEKRQAEAVEAANRANLPKRRDAIAQIEREQQQAQAAKTRAEADAIRMDAETRRLEAVAHARSELIVAISQLKQEGGDVFFDAVSLRQLLDCGVPPAAGHLDDLDSENSD